MKTNQRKTEKAEKKIKMCPSVGSNLDISIYFSICLPIRPPTGWIRHIDAALVASGELRELREGRMCLPIRVIIYSLHIFQFERRSLISKGIEEYTRRSRFKTWPDTYFFFYFQLFQFLFGVVFTLKLYGLFS